MKNQQVNVDFWAMGKAMMTYGALTALCWLMLRLFNTVFTLPRRLRAQQDQMELSLKELQKRFPDLNITEEDLKNADKELDELIKEHDREEKEKLKATTSEDKEPVEEKKTI